MGLKDWKRRSFAKQLLVKVPEGSPITVRLELSLNYGPIEITVEANGRYSDRVSSRLSGDTLTISYAADTPRGITARNTGAAIATGSGTANSDVVIGNVGSDSSNLRYEAADKSCALLIHARPKVTVTITVSPGQMFAVV